jgi:hypothetical protein
LIGLIRSSINAFFGPFFGLRKYSKLLIASCQTQTDIRNLNAVLVSLKIIFNCLYIVALALINRTQIVQAVKVVRLDHLTSLETVNGFLLSFQLEIELAAPNESIAVVRVESSDLLVQPQTFLRI